MIKTKIHIGWALNIEPAVFLFWSKILWSLTANWNEMKKQKNHRNNEHENK